MPSLGADMAEGTLLEWLVHPGDTVHRGDVVAVVDTDKAAVEVECFTNGVVEELLVEPGTTVAVGTPLATLGDGAPAAATTSPLDHDRGSPVPPRGGPDLPRSPEGGGIAPASPLPRHRTKAGQTAPPAPRAGAEAASGRQRVSPYALRLARERGVDVSSLDASALDGTVHARDVTASEPVTESTSEPVAQPVSQPVTPRAPDADVRMREAIARLMTRSKREIPHYYLRTTIDLHEAMTWLRARNREVPVTQRIVPAALLLAATARAAVAVPEVNGYWVDDRLQIAESVHLGIAVSLRAGGMVTPALHDAQSLPLEEVMTRMRDLVGRARRGRLRASELTDATLTVTNLGDLGVEEVLGVIYPPQVAVVGFGAVVERPWAVDGLLGVRPLVTATLSADHRATDGYVGARFLDRLDRALQRPEEL